MIIDWHNQRVHELCRRIGGAIDDGHYTPYEASQALMTIAAVVCQNDRHFRRTISYFTEAWDRVASEREENGDNDDDE